MPRKRNIEMPPSDKRCVPISIDKDARDFENEHVHDVYEEIAPHFSHTRYNPWPSVLRCIDKCPSFGVVLDVGCGNGKYLSYRNDLVFVGSDRCKSLLEIALQKGSDLCICDCIKLPFNDQVADLAISIAVIHHVASREGRVRAISEMLRCTKPGGTILVYVWAMEQERDTIGYRSFESNDVLVPWHLQSRYCKERTSAPDTLVNYKRYYHVFSKDEVLELCKEFSDQATFEIRFEANNWIIEMSKFA
ncbi:methyltransferase domain-containing protein [Theileria equi strain WA]|uniref:Methyltransferase domain-containing protein n=1 Tax=Theileria equi strain WA TaxID=1537102 RepID=L0B0H5_THEEQ|nr:methyltransferase domain-containing protein [Theileria equi strain WA]AFZ80766.1 methyltransferase domain-containing protein [Theileria equi strain WA]|eukprot:XP_004830432.1 methyltransferase domain-containing protein [Theileria equi strain WA]